MFVFQQSSKAMQLTYTARMWWLGMTFSSSAPSHPSLLTFCLSPDGWAVRGRKFLQTRTIILVIFGGRAAFALFLALDCKQALDPCASSFNDQVQLGLWSCEWNPNNNSFSVIVQNYETGVGYEDVLLGNDVIFKCKIPSFVDDYVHIINWVDNDGVDHYPRIEKGKSGWGC